MAPDDGAKHDKLICIDPSGLSIQISGFVQRVGSGTGGMPTVDQSDMRGLITA